MHPDRAELRTSVTKPFAAIPMHNPTKLLLLFVLISRFLLAETFTLPVFPDTQAMLDGRFKKLDQFKAQLNWIVENNQKLKIPFVLHVGDIINFDTNDQHMWISASEGFALLDRAGIPYALANGNHDNAAVFGTGSAAPGDTHANLRNTNQFNKFFPTSRFGNQRGCCEPGKSENSYHTFTAGGLNWLVLTLEFCSRQAPVDWARTVLPRYPDHNVIILTHYHLSGRGEIATGNAGYGDLSPQQIFDQLVTRFSNIRMVLSGHVTFSATRNDPGVYGNRIYQILQNYQSEDHGGGYLRLLEVDTDAGTISGYMYSPYYNKTREDASAFKFEAVDFVRNTTIKAGDTPRQFHLGLPQGHEPFGVTFKASVSDRNADIAISLGTSTSAVQGVGIRFDQTGLIKALNGRTLSAESEIPYTPDTSYLFRIQLDPQAGRYSAFVTPPDGPEVALAKGYPINSSSTESEVFESAEVIIDGESLGSLTISPFLVVKPLPVSKQPALTVAAPLAVGDNSEHSAEKTIDQNPSTYWEAQGKMHWLLYDLGEVKSIDYVKIAWARGNSQTTHFDLQASTHLNTAWTTVPGPFKSGDTTNEAETFDFPDVAARYIRIMPRGNSVDDPTAISEVEIWGR